MEDFVMNEKGIERRGRVFGVATIATLVIGVSAAVWVINQMQPPPPVVIETPPQIKVVEKKVYIHPDLVVSPVVELPKTPELSTAPPEPMDPPAEPTTAKLVPTGVWDGVWRRSESPLPMFKLNQEGDGVAGTCAANWGAIVPVHGSSSKEDSLQFVVDDVVFRIHIRMTMEGQDRAKVVQWCTNDDWMTSLERANKKARTPQQARTLKTALRENAGKFRKPVTIGIFTRQPADITRPEK
jgi:hypothetical protein